jgi:cytochrome c-type biogenesis protein CcsB
MILTSMTLADLLAFLFFGLACGLGGSRGLRSARRDLPGWFGGAGQSLVALGLVLGLVHLGLAWAEGGAPPFKTLHQTLIFLAVTTSMAYLLWGRSSPWVGLGTALLLVLTLAYGFLKRDIDEVLMPPALQSAWFVPHVVVYFLGYAALVLSFVSSVLHLLSSRSGSGVADSIVPVPACPERASASRRAPASPEPEASVLSSDRFDRVAYRSARFGFLMISAGLVFGAVWAKFAWGDWWSWDPKENWALVSWAIYGAYLHLRHVPGLSSKTLAWVCIAGFLAVMFTYLGVSLLPHAAGALHSYQ